MTRPSSLRRLLSLPQRLVQRAAEIWRLPADQRKLQAAQQELQATQQELAGQVAQLKRDHDELVAWVRQFYQELVPTLGKKIEQDQFDRLSQNFLAILHREVKVLQSAGVRSDVAPVQEVRLPATSNTHGDDSFYLALEQRFRGTAQEITERLQVYLAHMLASDHPPASLIDIGCGRGEWLALLGSRQIRSSGVDLNPINVDYCISRGLQADGGDALAYLSALPDSSVDAVTAFHVVEHLPFDALLAITDQIFRVLRPNGWLIYETPNPENLLVATQTFWIDPTHLRPLPPDLLQFVVQQRGFERPDVWRLHPLEDTADTAGMNPASRQLQQLLTGPRDYAILARKPA